MCAGLVQCSQRIRAVEVAGIKIIGDNGDGNNDIQCLLQRRGSRKLQVS